MSAKHLTRRDFLKTAGYGAIALSAMPFSCSRKPGYELTREVVQDPETGKSYELIRNPAEPLYGERGSAEKVLEIGDTGLEGADEKYIFANIRDVSFKGDTIYVADELERNIWVFGTDGDYQRTIGGKGQGPGEFSTLIDHIHVDDDGFVYVYERNGSFSIFNEDHKFLRKHNIKALAKGITEVYDIAAFDPENFLLHCSFRWAMTTSTRTAYDNENKDLFVRLNKDGEWFSFGPNRGYPGFEKSIKYLKSTTSPTVRRSIDYNLYFPIILSYKNMFLDKGNELLYSSLKAFPSRAVVHSSDDGGILRIIEKGIAENERLYITQEVDRKESSNTPETPFHRTWTNDFTRRHYYFREEGMGVFAGDANIYNVYKIRSTDGNSLRVRHYMDIFDLSGTYKQRVPLDMEPGSIFAGMDDEGNMVVFRKNPLPVIEKYQLIGLEKGRKDLR